jgi:hypothetical protein
MTVSVHRPLVKEIAFWGFQENRKSDILIRLSTGEKISQKRGKYQSEKRKRGELLRFQADREPRQKPNVI